ncbi:MAG: glycosyltransferase, partial [Actinomycetes bacterium]
MRALVVIPTYNEAESVVEVIDRVLAAEPRADVLVVDDG